jgi:hypothetical protein
MVRICVRSERPCFRNSENVEIKRGRLAVADRYRTCLHNSGERGEELTDFFDFRCSAPILCSEVPLIGENLLDSLDNVRWRIENLLHQLFELFA